MKNDKEVQKEDTVKFDKVDINPKKKNIKNKKIKKAENILAADKIISQLDLIVNSDVVSEINEKPIKIDNKHPEIKESLESIIDSLDLGDDATISSDPRGVVLEVDGDICFPSLSSDLDLQFIEILKEVTSQVMSHPYDKRTVIIEGHSDSDPIRPDQKYHKNPAVNAIEVWRTNRHLSSARASEVVEYLVDSLNI